MAIIFWTLLFLFPLFHLGAEEVLRGILVEKVEEKPISGKERKRVLSQIEKKGGVALLGIEEGKCVYEERLFSLLGLPLEENTLRKIEEVSHRFFRSEGYPVIRVMIPEQEVKKGIVQVRIYESRVDTISFQGASWSDPKALRTFLHLEPGDRIDQNRLLKDLYLLNQNPLRSIQLLYQPGSKKNTTNLLFLVDEEKPLQLFAAADNTGVASTGRQRWMSGFFWGKAFGLPHTLSFQYTTSTDFQKFQAYTVQYLAPLSWGHLLNVYGGYATVTTWASAKKNTGQSGQASLRYTVPARCKEAFEILWSLGADYKRTNNTVQFSGSEEVFGQNVNLTQAVATLRYVWQGSDSIFRADGALYGSPGQWLPDQSDSDYQRLRPEAKNQWLYATLLLGYDKRVAHGFVWSFLFRGQLSSTPLLPSEQIGLGGYDTVRGYDERQITMDQGLLCNLSCYTPPVSILRYWKPKVEDTLKFLVFFDFGWGENLAGVPGLDNPQYLAGIGPGLRYEMPPYIDLRFDWGIRLHKDEELGDSASRIHFGLRASY